VHSFYSVSSLENWLVWIGVDVRYVGMFIFKHVYRIDWRHAMAELASAPPVAA
jgi:nicotinamide riboside transporter PnuC